MGGILPWVSAQTEETLNLVQRPELGSEVRLERSRRTPPTSRRSKRMPRTASSLSLSKDNIECTAIHSLRYGFTKKLNHVFLLAFKQEYYNIENVLITTNLLK